MIDENWLLRVMACVSNHLPADILSCHNSYELGIALVDEDYIRQLNADYRGKDKPTNVLSFCSDMSDTIANNLPTYPLGDLVICTPVLCREANMQHKSFHDHFIHLLIHGILHLFGYDHEKSAADCQKMENLEITLLAKLGINNPYTAIDGQP